MQVEECCQHLLRILLPEVDPKRSGTAIDVGVGTFSFFCETFAKIGYRTIAVEPMPVDDLKRLCERHHIQLIESALSDIDGSLTLYIGSYEGTENYNLNSLHADWWGGSSQTHQVSSITLPKLLARVNAIQVTCMKIDVEGAEQNILSQFPALPESQLPLIVMFEFGGGASRHEEMGGWSREYLASTMQCLRLLRQCGFEDALVIESAALRERMVNLQTMILTENEFFNPNAVYGNIIAFRQHHPDRQKIADICQLYANYGLPPQGRIAKLWHIIRRLRNDD